MNDPSNSSNPFGVPWRIRDVFFAIIATHISGLTLAIGVIVILAVWLGVTAPMDADIKALGSQLEQVLQSEPWSLAFLLVSYACMLFFTWLFVLRKQGSKAKGLFFTSPSAVRDVRYALKLLFWCMLVTMGLTLLIVGLIMLVSAALSKEAAPLIEGYLEGLSKDAELHKVLEVNWIFHLIAVVLGPLLEEILYRGCLYGSLRTRMRPWKANALSSAVFALSHPYFFGLPSVMVAGVLGAYAYEKTRSLRASIIFHMLWNLMASAAGKPILWPVLITVVVGLMIWVLRTTPKASVIKQDRRWGWKVYACVMLLLYFIFGLMDPEDLVQIGIELPIVFGLFVYAWRKSVFPKIVWAGLAYFYIVYNFADWHAVITPVAQRSAWEQWMAGDVFYDVFSAQEMAEALIEFVVLIAPGLIVLLRLGRGGPALGGSGN